MKTIDRILCVILVVLMAGCTPSPERKAPGEETSREFALQKGEVFQTAESTGERMSRTSDITFADYGQPSESQPCVFIDPLQEFQEFAGIGAALSDASGEVFSRLSAERQEELLRAYFDPEQGINYRFARTNIASCDFSSASYDYVEPLDSTLATFSIDHDREYRIPFIKKAIDASGGELKMFVSPWSPPAWMKDNNDRLHGGRLLDRYRQTWADHFVKFIQAYEAEGVPVWGLSVQNEPMAVQRWESCIYTATDERDFVKDYLGPTLEKNGLKNKKLIVWDHNRDLIYHRASVILNDPEAAKYVWGVGFHWYEPWTGSDMQFGNLKLVHEAFPDKHLVFTEGCVESFRYEEMTDWRLGERYGYSMLNDFNSGTVAWTDWNILLNEHGGPNHVGNFCFAPVHADLSKDSLIYTNSYYYIGHFSRYIQPGARRIACSSNRDVIQATAFRNPDGGIAVVVLNTTDQAMEYKLWCQGKAADMKSLPHSIVTVLL